MILVHFVLLGPTFPCGDLQPTHKTHFFLCCEWWLSQLPELISPLMMAALCLVHAPISHYNPFLVFICPSELSTRVHLHEGWCIILPILTAQHWLWEGQGALLKNLRTKSTNEKDRLRAEAVALPLTRQMIRVCCLTFVSISSPSCKTQIGLVICQDCCEDERT